MKILQQIDGKNEDLIENNQSKKEELPVNSKQENFEKHESIANSIDMKKEIKFNSLDYLDTEKQKSISHLIKKYGHIFAENKYDVGKIKKIEAELSEEEEKTLQNIYSIQQRNRISDR